MKLNIFATDLMFYMFLMLAFVFLLLVGIPAINQEIDFQFYADTTTYLELAESNLTMKEIFLLGINLSGPVLLLRLVNNSHVIIFLIQILIAIYFYKTIINYYHIKRRTLFIYLLISPIFFSSIILINKEIYALLVISLILRYDKTQNYYYLLLSLLVAPLVRWQMLLFTIVLISFLSIKPLKKHPFRYILLMLACISMIYYFSIDSFKHFNEVLELARITREDSGGGSFFVLMDIQNSNPFGYFFAMLPKFIHMYLALIMRYANFFDFSNFYNNVVIFSQVLCQWIVSVHIFIKFRKKSLNLKSVFLVSAIIYVVIFSLSPIYSPRYFFPVYLMLAIFVSEKNVDNNVRRLYKA